MDMKKLGIIILAVSHSKRLSQNDKIDLYDNADNQIGIQYQFEKLLLQKVTRVVFEPKHQL